MVFSFAPLRFLHIFLDLCKRHCNLSVCFYKADLKPMNIKIESKFMSFFFFCLNMNTKPLKKNIVTIWT